MPPRAKPEPEPPVMWDTESANAYESGKQRRDFLLALGFEPFAVSGGEMFFRRQLPPVTA